MFFSSWETIDNFDARSDTIRRRRYGVIETSGQRFVAIHFRPWPKLLAWPEIWPAGPVYHARGKQDRCLLYYNQPLRHSNFLALRYVVSTHGSSYGTVCAALDVLDAIARLKGTDALLCDAANSRISDRLMQRQGWQPHRPSRWHRNFIKRFYGQYPEVPQAVFGAEAALAAYGKNRVDHSVSS